MWSHKLSKQPDQSTNHQYYTELNRVNSILFAGVLAVMTFLLTVGVQRPHATFAWALYSAIIVLALNLVAYVAGNLFQNEYLAKLGESDEAKAKLESARRRLHVIRIIQQALFIIGVGCVAWLAISAANFFFSIPATPSAPSPQ